MMTKRQLIAFENKVANLFLKGKVKVPIHLSGGNEDQLIEIFKNIKRRDYVFSTHRNHYHYLLHTGDTKGLMSEILRDAKRGVCRGQSGSMHTINHKKRFYSSGIVCGLVNIACGVGCALRDKGSRTHVWVFIGDGAVDSGWFSEAVKYTICKELPVTYIVEDNDRSVCASKFDRWGRGKIRPISDIIIYYKYKPTYPHVGCGQWVTF